jgi:hypothetical protein
MKFSTVWDMEYWMKSNGFFVGLNTPKALISKKDKENEFCHQLPPYAKQKSFLVDEYPACPKSWLRSEGKTTSYFVPVEEGKGLWLDFNKNNDQKYHVAIIISIQGVNPITGLPCNNAQLEQYIESCPKCKEKFRPERLCKKCGYKWPKQNYICTTATPHGELWLDGFRSAEGIVRQYILTQEKIRGVANNLIGEDRVYAIGISFFLSKNPKPIKQQPSIVRQIAPSTPYIYDITKPWDTIGITTPLDTISNQMYDTNIRYLYPKNDNTNNNVDTNYFSCQCSTNNSLANKTLKKISNTSHSLLQKNVETQALEVGAGAKINQFVYDDPETLNFWRENPESIICINYVDYISCEKILKFGKTELITKGEGFLQEIQVGN